MGRRAEREAFAVEVPPTASGRALMKLARRFFAKLDKTDSCPVPGLPGGGCWLWKRGKSRGYGRFFVSSKGVKAARFSYEYHRGPIPDGLEPDHLCRVSACVNPWHLEAVSHRDNVLRGESPAAVNAQKTKCKNGHQFTPENTITYPKGSRRCLICRRRYHRVYNRAARRAVRRVVPGSAG
jgi:hypothetical protein